MITRTNPGAPAQTDLFRALLRDIISPANPLVRLADAIDWKALEDAFAGCYCADNGRPACPLRVMIGLQYLKHANGISDDDTLAAWCENPYWQHLCGMTHFEHEPPTDQATMSRWRRRVGEAGAEALLAQTLSAGLRTRVIRPAEFSHVNVDTTVQPKNIRFPTDARLYDRMRERLARQARREGVALRRTYARKGRQALRRQSGYAKAKQFKRAARETRRLKGYLRRVAGDAARAGASASPALLGLLANARRLLAQQRHDKRKLYSVHEPQVECIAKGKVHAPYEFGVKVGLVTAARANWITGALAFPGNPYDGHTLAPALAQSERLCGTAHKMAACDLGYRGHGYEGPCDIQVVNRRRRRRSRALLRWWNRRSAIEPVIGHMKTGHGLGRNMLGGGLGDRLNVILAAAGFNLRKLLRAFARLLRLFFARAAAGLARRIRSFIHGLCPPRHSAGVTRRALGAFA